MGYMRHAEQKSAVRSVLFIKLDTVKSSEFSIKKRSVPGEVIIIYSVETSKILPSVSKYIYIFNL